MTYASLLDLQDTDPEDLNFNKIDKHGMMASVTLEVEKSSNLSVASSDYTNEIGASERVESKILEENKYSTFEEGADKSTSQNSVDIKKGAWVKVIRTPVSCRTFCIGGMYNNQIRELKIQTSKESLPIRLEPIHVFRLLKVKVCHNIFSPLFYHYEVVEHSADEFSPDEQKFKMKE